MNKLKIKQELDEMIQTIIDNNLLPCGLTSYKEHQIENFKYNVYTNSTRDYIGFYIEEYNKPQIQIQCYKKNNYFKYFIIIEDVFKQNNISNQIEYMYKYIKFIFEDVEYFRKDSEDIIQELKELKELNQDKKDIIKEIKKKEQYIKNYYNLTQ